MDEKQPNLPDSAQTRDVLSQQLCRHYYTSRDFCFLSTLDAGSDSFLMLTLQDLENGTSQGCAHLASPSSPVIVASDSCCHQLMQPGL